MTIAKFPTREANFDLDTSEAVFPICERDIQTVPGDKAGLEAPSHKAIVRADSEGGNPRVIGVVGSDYKLLRNKPFFGALEGSLTRAIEPSLLEGAKVATETSFDGAWVQREYVFPRFAEELKTSTAFSTNIGFRVIGWNSYDGSSSAGVASGLIDFFCTNGMVMGSMIDLTKRRHTKNLREDHFDGQIYRGVERVQEEIRMLRQLATTDLDFAAADQLLRDAFSERRADALISRLRVEAEVRGANVFALHSALTFYASHNSDEFGVRKTGNDNVAKTLHNREAEVAKLMPAVFKLAA